MKPMTLEQRKELLLAPINPSLTIDLKTHSEYIFKKGDEPKLCTHCNFLMEKNDKYYVFLPIEDVQALFNFCESCFKDNFNVKQTIKIKKESNVNRSYFHAYATQERWNKVRKQCL